MDVHGVPQMAETITRLTVDCGCHASDQVVLKLKNRSISFAMLHVLTETWKFKNLYFQIWVTHADGAHATLEVTIVQWLNVFTIQYPV